MARINGDRLWNDIMMTSQWGRLPEREGGMSRLALTDEDLLVRDWFCKTAKDIGCDVKVDRMGNIFATLNGENSDIPPVGIGSHLDTQPAGGRFDGILGVLSGLEILRSIQESNIKLYAGLTVINWTNEEGAKFSPGCTGAAVWSGHTPISSAYERKSNCGTTTLGAELSRISYVGDIPASHQSNQLSAHFELHIEQGSRLESAGQKVGVVDAIQGIRWFRIRATGERGHSGSTPIWKRADALVAASKIVLLLEELCIEYDAFGTVGTMDLADASPNAISGDVSFSIDMRHPDEYVLTEMEEVIRDRMQSISKGRGGRINFDMQRIWHSPAQVFDPVMVRCIEEAGENRCGDVGLVQRMRSHAGHDSALVALAECPTAMLFAPSKNGISHAPEEWTDKEDCAIGADTLFQAVMLYDKHLRSLKTDGGRI